METMLVNIDEYIIIFFNYVHANPITFGALWGLLKLATINSETSVDDSILTWIGSKFGVKF